MQSAPSCYCAELRNWGQGSLKRDKFGPFMRKTHFVQTKKWIIEPARRLGIWAAEGCLTCELIIRAIDQVAPGVKYDQVSLTLSDTVRQLKMTVVNRDFERSFYLAHPHGYHGYEPFGASILRAPEQPHRLDLAYNPDAAIQQIQQWTRVCLQNHRSCASGDFAPTRLLCLAGSRGQKTIRLIETWSNFSSPFIALSHCWGKTQQARTTKAKYLEHRSSVPMSNLSRTFLDAIWITEKLGLSYLWIDSLCIVQDDRQDWEKEASHMSRIYGAAYLTLAASHGSNGDAGVFPLAQDNYQSFLSTTNPENNSQHVLLIVTPILSLGAKSEVHQIFYRQEQHDIIFPLPTSEPLLTRGWTFQERALSARIVHFTRQELVWECKGTTHCACGKVQGTSFMAMLVESLGRWEPPKHYHDTWGIMKVNDHGTLISFPHFLTPKSLWEMLVAMYTQRQLSDQRDRQIAFDGIAQMFGNTMFLKDDEIIGEYVCGHWSAYLPGSLLWSCSTDSFLDPPRTIECKRIRNSSAPTWSWCSVSGQCAFLTTQKSLYRRGNTMFLDDPFATEVNFLIHEVEDLAYGLFEGPLYILKPNLLLANRSNVDESFSIVGSSGQKCISMNVYFIPDDPSDEKVLGDIHCFCIRTGRHFDPSPSEYIDSENDIDRFLYDDEILYSSRESLIRTDFDNIDFSPDWDDDSTWFGPIHDRPGLQVYAGLRECTAHVFGLALIKERGLDGNETYRRVGLVHVQGDGCVWKRDDQSVLPCRYEVECLSADFQREYRAALYQLEVITLS